MFYLVALFIINKNISLVSEEIEFTSKNKNTRLE